jgi:hypothetical protein
MCVAQPSNPDNAKAKALLDRIVAVLTKLGQRGYSVHETPSDYRTDRIDTDSDADPDTDGGKEPKDRQQGAAADAASRRG